MGQQFPGTANQIAVGGRDANLGRGTRGGSQAPRPSGRVAPIAEHRDQPPGSAGRYYGEVEFRLSYGEVRGEPYPWLFVDAQRLQRHAEAAGFDFEIGAWGARGAYLAQLSKR